jgi:hypothetical protein
MECRARLAAGKMHLTGEEDGGPERSGPPFCGFLPVGVLPVIFLPSAPELVAVRLATSGFIW